MFIEKFLFKVSEQISDKLIKFELLEVNIEQIEHALTQFLTPKTKLQEIIINGKNFNHGVTKPH